MFARVSKYRAPPNRPEEEARRRVEEVRENSLARITRCAGFERAYFLVDPSSGDSMSITIWESEEAMKASEEIGARLRTEIHHGDTIESVERYEVALEAEAEEAAEAERRAA